MSCLIYIDEKVYSAQLQYLLQTIIYSNIITVKMIFSCCLRSSDDELTVEELLKGRKRDHDSSDEDEFEKEMDMELENVLRNYQSHSKNVFMVYLYQYLTNYGLACMVVTSDS